MTSRPWGAASWRIYVYWRTFSRRHKGNGGGPVRVAGMSSQRRRSEFIDIYKLWL